MATHKAAGPTCKILDDNITKLTCPLDNGRHQGNIKHDLGDLDRLPLELQSDILVRLDLQTLTDFRRVNRKAMDNVDALPEYKAILLHNKNSLRAILSVELGRFITCNELYITLQTKICERCGESAEFIYLLTCRRVCATCLCRRIEYCPITIEDAERRFQVPCHPIQKLPAMRSLPGPFGPIGKTCLHCYTLIDSSLAFLVGATNRAGRRPACSAVPGPAMPLSKSREMEVPTVDRHMFDGRYMSVVQAHRIETPGMVSE